MIQMSTNDEYDASDRTDHSTAASLSFLLCDACLLSIANSYPMSDESFKGAIQIEQEYDCVIADKKTGLIGFDNPDFKTRCWLSGIPSNIYSTFIEVSTIKKVCSLLNLRIEDLSTDVNPKTVVEISTHAAHKIAKAPKWTGALVY